MSRAYSTTELVVAWGRPFEPSFYTRGKLAPRKKVRLPSIARRQSMTSWLGSRIPGRRSRKWRPCTPREIAQMGAMDTLRGMKRKDRRETRQPPPFLYWRVHQAFLGYAPPILDRPQGVPNRGDGEGWVPSSTTDRR